MDLQKAMGIIEGILFISGNPVSIDEISKTLNITNEQALECVKQLKDNYDKP